MTTRAIILAAGEGSRLRPYTANKPKPMVSAANRPILQHALEALVANGIKDITIVAGYHRERIQSHFGDGRKFGAEIKYAFQDVLDSTVRALASAPLIREPTLVVSGDNVIGRDLVKALLDAPGQGPAVAVHRSETPERYGVVTLNGSRVASIIEKPRHPPSEWVNTGVYRLTPSIHASAIEAAAHSLEFSPGVPDLLQAAIVSGTPVEAVKTSALWTDAVYPWDLLRVHSDLLHALRPLPPSLPGIHIDGPILVGADTNLSPGTTLGAGTCIGSNVVIGPHCVLENCVVYDDVQIGAGSILRNTIVGAGSRIGPRMTALSGPTDVNLSDGWHHLDDFGGVLGEDCRIGGAVTLLPGTILGNQVHVAHGRTVGTVAEDRSHIL